MENELHRLESQSMYEDLPHETVPQVQRQDGVSTPSYAILNEPQRDHILISGLNAIQPEKYDGSSDPRRWLVHYESIAAANQWTKDLMFKMLPRALDAAPWYWHDNEVREAKKNHKTFDYEDFKRGLINRYTNRYEGKINEDQIKRRQQGENESLNLYWESKRNQLDVQCAHLSESDKIHHLVKGLKNPLLTKVSIKVSKEPPKDIDSAFKIAKRYDDEMKLSELFKQNLAYEDSGYDSRPKSNRLRSEGKSQNVDGQNRDILYRSSDYENRNSYDQDIRPYTDPLNRYERDPRLSAASRTQGYDSRKISNLEKQINQTNRNFKYTMKRIDQLETMVKPKGSMNEASTDRYERQNYENRYRPQRVQFEERPTNGGQRTDGNNRSLPRDARNETEPKVRPPIRRDISSVRCYRCNKLGHFANSCQEAINPNQKNE